MREVSGYLGDVAGLRLLSLKDFPSIPAVPEDETTFRGNAVMKAVEAGRAAACLTLADDSGLCVDALGGAPGVTSARYGGPGLDDPGRCLHLLKRLAATGDPERAARFECALALADAGRIVVVLDGVVEGRILEKPRGTNGFGYDPVFFYPPLAKSFAELTTEEKAAVSHRGRALAKLREFLARRPDLLRD